MSKKYTKLMDQITLDEEAKRRIRQNVVRKQSISLKHKQQFVLSLACMVVFVLVLPALINQTKQKENVQVVNPICEYDTLQELNKNGTIEMHGLDELEFSVDNVTYVSYNQELSEIHYYGTNELTYRKSYGKEDNSGYYDSSLLEEELTISGNTVILKRNEKGYVLAIYSDEQYSYSIYLKYEISKEELVEYVKQSLK